MFSNTLFSFGFVFLVLDPGDNAPEIGMWVPGFLARSVILLLLCLG